MVSTSPNGTLNDPKLLGQGSFFRYPFKHSTTKAGSSASSKVLYIPAAWVMFRGTHTCIPRTECTMAPMGDPLCQMPSKRWPRVRMMSGAFWPPAVRYRTVARSSRMI